MTPPSTCLLCSTAGAYARDAAQVAAPLDCDTERKTVTRKGESVSQPRLVCAGWQICWLCESVWHLHSSVSVSTSCVDVSKTLPLDWAHIRSVAATAAQLSAQRHNCKHTSWGEPDPEAASTALNLWNCTCSALHQGNSAPGSALLRRTAPTAAAQGSFAGFAAQRRGGGTEAAQAARQRRRHSSAALASFSSSDGSGCHPARASVTLPWWVCCGKRADSPLPALLWVKSAYPTTPSVHMSADASATMLVSQACKCVTTSSAVKPGV
jgi:hypothetical protein